MPGRLADRVVTQIEAPADAVGLVGQRRVHQFLVKEKRISRKPQFSRIEVDSTVNDGNRSIPENGSIYCNYEINN